MSALNPWDVYRQLVARARRDAKIVCGRPELGEDALQMVMERISAGDLRCLKNRAYFRRCVIYQVYDLLRRERRFVSIPALAGAEESDGERSDVLLTLGLFCEPHVLRDLARRDRARQLATVCRGLTEGLSRLKLDHAAAVKARLRQWLAESGGDEAVREFERDCQVDLGPHTGTAQLAAATGQPPGTVACHATRGLRALARRIEGLVHD